MPFIVPFITFYALIIAVKIARKTMDAHVRSEQKEEGVIWADSIINKILTDQIEQ